MEQKLEQSLRSTIHNFKRAGQLQFIEQEIDPRYELGALLLLQNRDSSLFFRNIKGFSMPIVGNLLNSRDKIALGLGVERKQLQAICIKALDCGITPVIAAKGPIKEIIYHAPVDIPKLLPVPTWFEKENGPYITAGVIVAKDPETGHRNVSIARLRVEGGDLLLAGIAPTHHLSELMRRAHKRGGPLEIAIIIGNHPAVLIASQMYVSLGHDEFDIAGGLMNEPLHLLRCESVNLEVPADAEIVLEGTLHADERIEEGLVSEFHGFYENYGQGHAIHINAVTHRSKPIYQTILPGYAAEHILLGAVAIGATTCRALQKVIPRVKRVFISDGGMGRLHAIITMHRPACGEAKRAIMLAMGTTNLLKLVIVVDDDINPEDWQQVEWAIAARMRGEEDIMIIPGMKSDRCDPQQKNMTVTKVGIVATTRPDGEESSRKFEYARPPKDVLEKIKRDLANYLGK